MSRTAGASCINSSASGIASASVASPVNQASFAALCRITGIAFGWMSPMTEFWRAGQVGEAGRVEGVDCARKGERVWLSHISMHILHLRSVAGPGSAVYSQNASTGTRQRKAGVVSAVRHRDDFKLRILVTGLWPRPGGDGVPQVVV